MDKYQIFGSIPIIYYQLKPKKLSNMVTGSSWRQFYSIEIKPVNLQFQDWRNKISSKNVTSGQRNTWNWIKTLFHLSIVIGDEQFSVTKAETNIFRTNYIPPVLKL